eukprot:10175664-Alexandrium_andersonii.AAC.1
MSPGELLQRPGEIPEGLPVAFQCGCDGFRRQPVAVLGEARLNDAGRAEGRRCGLRSQLQARGKAL